ncbi:putative golgin subfamily A member 6-like protein 19 [Trichomycterus rosablanca]|uniref:putative golgin subfamily A member 6-like protein 19 n=1 Tax=Trichomycterus rosablanca TaxID=2290929 RepID=UPI002F350BAD
MPWSAVRDRLLSFLRSCCPARRRHRLRELEAELRAERLATERLRARQGRDRKGLLEEVDYQIRMRMLSESVRKRHLLTSTWKEHLCETQLQQYQENVTSTTEETERARRNLQDVRRLRLMEEEQHRLEEEGLKVCWEEERSTMRQENEEKKEKRLLLAVEKAKELAAARTAREEQRSDA